MLKELHDGTMVDVNTPTKMVGDKRYLLTQQEITQQEALAITSAQQRQAKMAILQAQQLLEKSDLVAIRCYKDGKDFPSTWKKYVEQLRSVLRGETTKIPNQPEYP